MNEQKIWTDSGDSHFLEPPDLWQQILPRRQAARMPRSEVISDHEELVSVDGKRFTRQLPKLFWAKGTGGETIAEMSHRPPGSRDIKLRLDDLDHEGVWAEVMYASIGLWCSLIEDPTLIREAARAENEWLVSEIQAAGPDRLVCAALMPLLNVDDAVAEAAHAADIGLKIISLPTGSPPGMANWNDDSWEPLWATSAEANLVVGFHIGTDGGDQSAAYHGPGGAILNYVETTYGGQKVASMLVASGALDRHPDLKVLVSEGGRDLGSLSRRPDERGTSSARDVRAAGAVEAPQGDLVPAAVRQLPARRDRSGRAVGHGIPQRALRQRLPPFGRDLRAYPEDPSRAARRCGP